MRRIWKALTRKHEVGWGFTVLFGVLWCAFLIWMHVHHEMWRDEVHSWILARDAQSFGELVWGDRIYEGHPPLWFWYLHIWSWLTHEAWGIQAATVVAASGAAVLLLRYAPFPRYMKLLLLCSYYFGFEYTVMSRNYVCGWFLICAFCATYHPTRTRFALLGVLIAALSLTSVYGLIMACALWAFLLLSHVRVEAMDSAVAPKVIRLRCSPLLLLSLAVAAAGILFSVYSLEPPDPNPFSPGWHFDQLSTDDYSAPLDRVLEAFLPVRAVSPNFWESSPLWQPHLGAVQPVGAALVIVTVLTLLPAWRLSVSYLLAIGAMEVFQQTRYGGNSRHWGHYFMFFVAACWLARSARPRRSQIASTLLLLCVLPFQTAGFLAATVSDTRWVFSGGRDAANFIRHAGLQDLPLIGGLDYVVLTVAGYLVRPYYRIETEEVLGTVVFHNRRRQAFSPEGLVAAAVRLSKDRQSDVLLVNGERLTKEQQGPELTWLYTSLGATESFSVYRVSTH